MASAARPLALRAQAFGLVLALLGGCGGAATGMLQREGDQVDVGGDTFFVTRTARTATARNYATGLFNQERLFTNAQLAIASHTGCDIAHFEQETGVNLYRARLNCG